MKEGKSLQTGKVAVIDTGTNSVRLMVAEYDGITIGKRIKELHTTRLGEGLQNTGVLSPAAMERTAEAIRKFTLRAGELGAGQIYCFATNAVRSAQNGAEFVELTRQLAGITVDVISGEAEAETAFLGAAGGNGAVIDIGGGSTEVVFGQQGKIQYAHSFEIGVVRGMDALGGAYPGGSERAIAWAAEAIREAANHSFIHRSPSITGIGGTPTQMAALLLQLQSYDPEKVHGYVMDTGTVQTLVDRLWNTPLAERKKMPGMDPTRADVIPFGAAIALAFLRAAKIPKLVASENDNLEGYLLWKQPRQQFTDVECNQNHQKRPSESSLSDSQN